MWSEEGEEGEEEGEDLAFIGGASPGGLAPQKDLAFIGGASPGGLAFPKNDIFGLEFVLWCCKLDEKYENQVFYL